MLASIIAIYFVYVNCRNIKKQRNFANSAICTPVSQNKAGQGAKTAPASALISANWAGLQSGPVLPVPDASYILQGFDVEQLNAAIAQSDKFLAFEVAQYRADRFPVGS